MVNSYGIAIDDNELSQKQLHLEEFYRKGFTVIDSGLSPSEIEFANTRIEEIYLQQENEFGKENLKSISELDMARAPLVQDRFFTERIALNPAVLEIVKQVIDGAFQIHLQNGVINRPSLVHHQSSWHRDLPYQNWTSSKVLSVSAFFCLCDFTSKNGATFFLPYSHLFDMAPSKSFVENNKFQAVAKAGSVVIFNSMVLHCAGSNVSDKKRIGINNMYTIPLIKQQIDFTSEFAKKFPDLAEEHSNILGLSYNVPQSVTEWRQERLRKKVGAKK